MQRRECLSARTELTHHFEVGFFLKHARQSFPEHRVIVHEKKVDELCASGFHCAIASRLSVIPSQNKIPSLVAQTAVRPRSFGQPRAKHINQDPFHLRRAGKAGTAAPETRSRDRYPETESVPCLHSWKPQCRVAGQNLPARRGGCSG